MPPTHLRTGIVKPTRAWLAGLALVLVGAGLPAWPAEPTSAATRAEMIGLIDTLEKYPNDPQARVLRREVLAWLTEAPDVTVTVCGEFLGIRNFEPGQPSGELVLLQAFAEARFILENPDKARDVHAVHLAGLEAALRTYAVMKAENPELSIPSVEAIVNLQAEQKLPTHVTQAIKKCK